MKEVWMKRFTSGFLLLTGIWDPEYTQMSEMFR